MTDSDLTDDEREALNALVPRRQQTGDLTADLTAAARESMRRRQENSRLGGAVIRALHRRVRSWRLLELATGIPTRTARRWAEPPPSAEE